MVRLANGFPFSSELFSPQGLIPLVRIRDLLSSEFETYLPDWPPKAAMIQDDDIVIGMDGDFNLVLWERGAAALNQRLCSLRPRDGVDIRFIAYALPHVLSIINDLTFSTTVKHLSSSDILGERLLVPSLDEQRRIADFLDEETAQIDKLASLYAGASKLAAERDAVDIERRLLAAATRRVRLKFLVERPLSYGANAAAEHENTEWPRYIRITDIDEDGGLRSDTFRSLEPESARPYRLRNDDLLFARSGATVGKTFLYRASYGDACYAGYLIRARFPAGSSLAELVSFYSKTDDYWDQIGSDSIQATIQNVSAERYANVQIPVAPADDRPELLATLRQGSRTVRSLQATVGRQLATLAERRQRLITAAVTGQFDVTTGRGADLS